jgi:hypothetical protein
LDPARYGAELHPDEIIFDIPSYRNCQPITTLVIVRNHFRILPERIFESVFIGLY